MKIKENIIASSPSEEGEMLWKSLRGGRTTKIQKMSLGALVETNELDKDSLNQYNIFYGKFREMKCIWW